MNFSSPAVHAWFRLGAAILVVLVTFFGFLYGVGTLVNLITKKYSDPVPVVKPVDCLKGKHDN